MTMVSKVPTILQEIDLAMLFRLESVPFLEANHFLSDWSRIMQIQRYREAKVYKPYKNYRLYMKKILFLLENIV